MVTKKLNRHHALKILDWCGHRYGLSDYQDDFPYLEFRKTVEEYGYYEDYENTIYVSSVLNDTVEELASTIIEEYIHYTQDPVKYQKLYKNHSYLDHPMEVEAERIANRDCKICVEELKAMHKNFI
jgi:hypothetical protein